MGITAEGFIFVPKKEGKQDKIRRKNKADHREERTKRKTDIKVIVCLDSLLIFLLCGFVPFLPCTFSSVL